MNNLGDISINAGIQSMSLPGRDIKKTSPVHPNVIANARARKLAVRNHTTVDNYELQRTINLFALVNEYENAKQKKYSNDYCIKQHNLDLLELDGIESLEKAILAEDAVISEMNKDMEKYYQNVFDKMVHDYKIFDLAALYNSGYQRTTPKPQKYTPVTTKAQLRQIVNEHNHKHR
jgi:hypothetical protein